MIKKLMLINLFALSILASSPPDGAPTTVEVSVSCNENLEKINYDVPRLYYSLVGGCQALAKKNDPTIKPSALFKFFGTEHKTFNSDVPLKYMSATDYVCQYIMPRSAELDKDFGVKYNEEKNVAKTWKWFEEHMRQKAIIEPLSNLKKQLVEDDKEKRELAKKGIFFSGNTVIINPAAATDKSVGDDNCLNQ